MRWCRLIRARASNTWPRLEKSIRTARCRRSLIPKDPAARRCAFLIPARSCFIWPTNRQVSWSARRSAGIAVLTILIASGLGPFSGQAVHFQFVAPEGSDYARNRYRREAERHYQVVEDHLAGRTFIVGNTYTIVDMSLWGWLDRASRVLKGEADPIAAYPNIKKWFGAIDARPAVARARAVGTDHHFKQERDEEALRALFPSNYPAVA
jgi:glutathione S-transferase